MSITIKELAVNKLVILLVLKEVDFPLTKAQIIDIILQNNLINYFDIQQCIQELEESKMIEKVKDKDLFTYTNLGKQTIEALYPKIPKDIADLIKVFAAKNKDIIKLDTQVFASYVKKSDIEYIVILKVIENDITLIELKLNVVSSKQAKQICAKWKQSYFNVYDQVMNILIK